MRRFIPGAILAVLLLVIPASGRPAKNQTAISEEERNTQVIVRATEAMNRHDIAAYLAYFADDAENFGRSIGREGFRSRIQDIFATFPDYRHDIVEIIAEGDSVVIRNKASGTHRGIGRYALNGGMLVGVAPTNKRFEVQHIHWFKLRDGKIVSHTANRDDLGMMRQLGLLPSPPLPQISIGGASVLSAQQKGIDSLVERLGDALHRGDARKLANLFAEDADFTNVIDQSVRGRENIYRHHVPVFANRPRTRSVNILSHEFRMIAPTVAAVEVRWNNVHRPEPDGSKRSDRHGVWVAVASKHNEQWLFAFVRNVMLDDGSEASKPPRG